MNNDWIEIEEVIIFEADKDPGEGQLRIVGHLEKVNKIADKHNVSFHEAHQVIFGKGTSTFISESTKTSEKNGTTYTEKLFKIAGLTNEGRPIIVVFTPRDEGHAKRVITAWQLSKDSHEVKKLLNDCPQLKEKLNEFIKSKNV
jgi:uncharacterized DUF497 family protein